MTPDTVPDLATRLANAIDGARGGATVVIWRDDAERIKVALAAHPSPALDEERLARAIAIADGKREPMELAAINRDYAHLVAAEYARLSEPPQEPERPTPWKGRIVVQCVANAKGGWKHRWETVPGTMSTPEHPYTERRCRHCGQYESEVR